MNNKNLKKFGRAAGIQIEDVGCHAFSGTKIKPEDVGLSKDAFVRSNSFDDQMSSLVPVHRSNNESNCYTQNNTNVEQEDYDWDKK